MDTKDISDMRDEKTKMRDMLQEKENEQLAQIKKMQQMMTKGEGGKVEDSIGASTSKSRITESYNSDTFEDNSLSGSGKKPGLQYWPGKEKMGMDESSASQSKEQ